LVTTTDGQDFTEVILYYCDFTSGATLHILGSTRDQQQQHNWYISVVTVTGTAGVKKSLLGQCCFM